MNIWWTRAIELVTGGAHATTGEVMLRGALIGCTLFAAGQLLTMMATRWGDRHAMMKSFVLSVLVHLCIALGWASVVTTSPAYVVPSAEAAPIPVRQVMVERDDEVPQPEAGNTPIWSQPLSLPNPQATRSERTPTELPEPAPTPLTPAPSIAPAPELPALPTIAETPAATPQRTAMIEPIPANMPAAASGIPEAITTEARRDLGPVAIASRNAVTRVPTSEPLPDLAPTSGAALRTAPQPDAQSLALPLPVDENPSVPRPVGPVAESITRKASPTATPIDDPAVGATAATNSAEPRFQRAQPRTQMADAGATAQRAAAASPTVDLNVERLQTATRPSGVPMDDTPQPALVRISPTSPAFGAKPQSAATTYRLRRLEARKDIALKNGGTIASERAVEKALAWLSSTQEPDGYWDADKHGGGQRESRRIDNGKPPGGAETDTGVTGLAVLSFLGAGYTHEEGDYADNVLRAIRWMIEQQRSDGYLGGKATYYDQMYCHGIAVYALAEALGMQNDPMELPELREAVARGVWYIEQTQNTDGGWRYRVGASPSDMSIFGWQLMALKSAELAGLEIPAKTKRGMIQFLTDRSRGAQRGLAGYKADGDQSEPTPAMTAEALFCKQISGLRRSSPASLEAVSYLERHLPSLAKPNEYYWYYGTLAMFQYGGPPWDAWNAALRDNLVRLQRTGGPYPGSWDPAGEWGSVGGRIYSTTLSVMCLEVYYRFLPLYQVTGQE